MSYTNSSLVDYTKISPNRTTGRECIDTITIHCVVGQCSVETLGSLFSQISKQASSNYGVGYDGRIGMYVEEKDRSWCTSSSANDKRAITIEVASDTYAPYAVREAAYKSTIRLVADICKRNNIKELKWRADKSLIGQVNLQNMTAHRWFANKGCPGDYLYDRFGEIAAEVNKILNGSSSDSDYVPDEVVIVRPVLRKGSYGYYTKELQEKLKSLGYPLGKYGVDSSFGGDTEYAVKYFQSMNVLEDDGVVGEKTWSVLNSDDAIEYRATIRAGSDGDSVKRCQEYLVKAGFSVGEKGVDGKFGVDTRKAVMEFQDKNGLFVDGIVGPKTWAKLVKYE